MTVFWNFGKLIQSRAAFGPKFVLAQIITNAKIYESSDEMR